MKVGILTYHRSHNYGALLQAVALRHVLVQMGHEVYFVDYWPEYHRNMYSVVNRSILKQLNFPRKIKFLIHTFLKFPNIWKRRAKFLRFISQYIQPYCVDPSEHFEMIVCGSDQIWRKQPALGFRFNPTYFGAGRTNADKYCSYAASMGIIDLNSEDKANLKKWLSGFIYISVRENNLKEALQEIGLRDVHQVLDPTLLLDKEKWTALFPDCNRRIIKGRYVLFYDLMPNSFNLRAIEEFSRQRNLKLIILKGGADRIMNKENEITDADPIEMMSLIKNAEFVFTSSFHGLVFSIIFNRQFITSFAHNADRAKSLLGSLGLEERLVAPNIICIPSHMRDAINYIETNNILKSIAFQSLGIFNEINT